MWTVYTLCLLGLGILGTFAVEEKFKNDLFNLYKNVALETREVTGTPVYPENITYYLFTKENPTELKTVDYRNPSEISDKNANYVFLIHGWTSKRENGWYDDLKDAYLSRRDDRYNVIQVDWSGPANELYAVSSINTRDVGKLVGSFIVKLNKENQIPLEHISIVGHSLGGQVAGYAAKKVFNETGHKLPRITGLDPAGPLFSIRPEVERLNPNDAEVVAVVHTDGGKLGFEPPTGTIDFFPNGGSDQPGCTKIDLIDITSVGDPIWCDHHRAWEFFIEAVLNPDKFESTKCNVEKKLLVFEKKTCSENDTVNIGDLKTKKTGNYYLETNNEKPFAKKTSRFEISKLIPQL